jgi:catechol-2,3-dioxygenase
LRQKKYLSLTAYHQHIAFRDWSYRNRHKYRSLFIKCYKTSTPLYKQQVTPTPTSPDDPSIY